MSMSSSMSMTMSMSMSMLYRTHNTLIGQPCAHIHGSIMPVWLSHSLQTVATPWLPIPQAPTTDPSPLRATRVQRNVVQWSITHTPHVSAIGSRLSLALAVGAPRLEHARMCHHVDHAYRISCWKLLTIGATSAERSEEQLTHGCSHCGGWVCSQYARSRSSP